MSWRVEHTDWRLVFFHSGFHDKKALRKLTNDAQRIMNSSEIALIYLHFFLNYL